MRFMQQMDAIRGNIITRSIVNGALQYIVVKRILSVVDSKK